MVGKGHKDRYAQRMQPFQKTEDLAEWEMSLDEGFFLPDWRGPVHARSLHSVGPTELKYFRPQQLSLKPSLSQGKLDEFLEALCFQTNHFNGLIYWPSRLSVRD